MVNEYVEPLDVANTQELDVEVRTLVQYETAAVVVLVAVPTYAGALPVPDVYSNDDPVNAVPAPEAVTTELEVSAAPLFALVPKYPLMLTEAAPVYAPVTAVVAADVNVIVNVITEAIVSPAGRTIFESSPVIVIPRPATGVHVPVPFFRTITVEEVIESIAHVAESAALTDETVTELEEDA